jgi:hypothetical protein
MRREVLPPKRIASPAGAILLSTSTMLLAIAASTLLLRERAFSKGSTTLAPGKSEPVMIRPVTPCRATRSMPLIPLAVPAMSDATPAPATTSSITPAMIDATAAALLR